MLITPIAGLCKPKPSDIMSISYIYSSYSLYIVCCFLIQIAPYQIMYYREMHSIKYH